MDFVELDGFTTRKIPFVGKSMVEFNPSIKNLKKTIRLQKSCYSRLDIEIQAYRPQYGVEILGSHYGVEILGSRYRVEILGSQYAVKILGSRYRVEILGSWYGVEILGSQYGVEILGSRYGVEILEFLPLVFVFFVFFLKRTGVLTLYVMILFCLIRISTVSY